MDQDKELYNRVENDLGRIKKKYSTWRYRFKKKMDQEDIDVLTKGFLKLRETIYVSRSQEKMRAFTEEYTNLAMEIRSFCAKYKNTGASKLPQELFDEHPHKDHVYCDVSLPHFGGYGSCIHKRPRSGVGGCGECPVVEF